jgi:hypothetical protein
MLTVNGRFLSWTDRLAGVNDGADLAAAVQADGHRYVVCNAGTGPQRQLHFCEPTTCARAATYDSAQPADGLTALTRSDTTGPATFVGRLPAPRPQFTSSSRKVTVRWIGRDRSARNLVVYLDPPAGSCP